MSTTLIGIGVSVQGDVQPWVSWEDTHFGWLAQAWAIEVFANGDRGWCAGFSRVDQFPAALWRADPGAKFALEGPRWVTVLSGLLFFAFFGFAEEARRHYQAAYVAAARQLGAKIGEDETSAGSRGIGFKLKQKTSGLKREVISQRDSLESISTGTLSFQFQDVGGLLTNSAVNGEMATKNAADAASSGLLSGSGSETTQRSIARTPATQDADLEAGKSFLDLSEMPNM